MTTHFLNLEFSEMTHLCQPNETKEYISGSLVTQVGGIFKMNEYIYICVLKVYRSGTICLISPNPIEFASV